MEHISLSKLVRNLQNLTACHTYHYFFDICIQILALIVNVQKGKTPIKISIFVYLSIRPRYRNLLVNSNSFLDGEIKN